MRRDASILLVFLWAAAIPSLAQSAGSLYRAGVKAENKGNYDVGYEALKRAHEKKPNDPAFTAAYLKARLYASAQHIQAGQGLRDVYKLQEALAEFRRAAEIDASNFEAFQEIRRTTELINKKQDLQQAPPNAPRMQEVSAVAKAAMAAAPPVMLASFPNEAVSLHLTAPSDVIYKTVGKLAGINVLMDPEYKPQKMTVEVKDVELRDALSMIAMQSKTFWRPVSTNTILVTSDSSGKRKDLEQNVMMTFYLKNASTPADLQQAASTLKGILDITRIQVTPEQRSLTIRATPDQLVLAERLLRQIDKARAEVMIEIAVLEVSRGKVLNLGVNPPTSISASVQPNVGGSSGVLTLSSLGSAFNSNNVVVSIPGASLTALMTDSNTKVIQKPQIRAMDSEKATLKIGDRIPVATGSYQSGLTNGVNTQFTYIDVGVNVDIVPFVHANRDVTLKMAFEVSSVTGEQTVDGVTEPTIGQRRIEHQVRLADGEVNLIGGILQDSEAHSMSGLPWISKMPILKYLFGQENRNKQQNEIIFAITPHIVRALDAPDSEEKMVDMGSGSTVTYRTVQAPEPLATPESVKEVTALPAQPAMPTQQAKQVSAPRP